MDAREFFNISKIEECIIKYEKEINNKEFQFLSELEECQKVHLINFLMHELDIPCLNYMESIPSRTIVFWQKPNLIIPINIKEIKEYAITNYPCSFNPKSLTYNNSININNLSIENKQIYLEHDFIIKSEYEVFNWLKDISHEPIIYNISVNESINLPILKEIFTRRTNIN